MDGEIKPKVQIYYDGVCNLCSGLMDSIDHSEQGTRFELKDAHINPLPEGVTMDAAMRDMYVTDEKGMYKGADAVIRIMREYPHLKWLAALASLPGFHLLAKGIYRIVEKTRYWIFGRKTV